MFCIACGTRLPDDAAFCSQCGRATYKGDTSPASIAQAASPAVSETPAQPASARRWSEAAGVPFLFEGKWWSRGPSGEVVVWDPAHADWGLALAAQTPFFMRRPRFASLRKPAVWLYVFLGFSLLFSILAVASDFEATNVAQQLKDGKEVSQARIDDTDATLDAMKGLQAITIIGLGVMFVWWTYRATRNLPALGARALQFTPGWSIAWWFIPLANWIQPARVLAQAWKASDPTLPVEQNDDWLRRPVDSVLVLWWLAWLAGNIAWNYTFFQWDSRDLDASGRFSWSIALACADIIMAVAAVLAIVFIRRLTARQTLANARFDVPAPSATPSTAASATAASW